MFLTFAWNYLDYFIIMLSIGIAERFHQINEYLNETYQKSSNKVFFRFFFKLLHWEGGGHYFSFQLAQIEFWKLIRHHFGLVCEILEHVDENVSVIIIVSCLSNLYFICLQVLNITV